jgi:hypothetical protein
MWKEVQDTLSIEHLQMFLVSTLCWLEAELPPWVKAKDAAIGDTRVVQEFAVDPHN